MANTTINLPSLSPATFPRNIGTESWTAKEIRAHDIAVTKAVLTHIDIMAGDSAAYQQGWVGFIDAVRALKIEWKT